MSARLWLAFIFPGRVCFEVPHGFRQRSLPHRRHVTTFPIKTARIGDPPRWIIGPEYPFHAVEYVVAFFVDPGQDRPRFAFIPARKPDQSRDAPPFANSSHRNITGALRSGGRREDGRGDDVSSNTRMTIDRHAGTLLAGIHSSQWIMNWCSSRILAKTKPGGRFIQPRDVGYFSLVVKASAIPAAPPSAATSPGPDRIAVPGRQAARGSLRR